MKKYLIAALCLISSIANAGLISRTNYVDGQTITAALQNTNENTVVTAINGNIDSSNITDGSIATADIADNAITNGKLASAVQATLVPTGVIIAYGGSSAPTGWLLCDGSAVSRTTYATLFGIISTSYGVGDNSTTFNLPNMSTATAVGKTTNGVLNTLGLTGGATSYSYTSTSNGSHSHTLGTSGTHASINYSAGLDMGDDGTSSHALRAVNAGGGETLTVRIADTNSQGAHTHVTNLTNTLPPYVVVNYIIKT